MEGLSTMLQFDALKRDLARYGDSVTDYERARIMTRMVDTVVQAREEAGVPVTTAQAMEIIAEMI